MNEQPSSGPQPRVRQTLLWVLKIVVSVGLLVVLLTRVDLARLWELSRAASIGWLAIALLIYFIGVVISVWRWGLLLDTQHVTIRFPARLKSYLVAVFFNNFLPSNIGGDVIRIRDTAGAAGSKTLATTVILVDRGLGLLGVVFVAATGATLAARMSAAIGPMAPGMLWGVLALAIALAAPVVLLPHGVGKLLSPLRAIHQEWVEERIQKLTSALARFRERPQALVACFAGAIVVQSLRRLLLLGDRGRAEPARPARAPGDRRADVAGRADAADVSQWLWSTRGDVWVLFHSPGPTTRVCARAVVHRRGLDNDLFHVRCAVLVAATAGARVTFMKYRSEEL